jgi:hypothetical protein
MIKPILFAVLLPFAQGSKGTPLNAPLSMSECQPVTEEYIDFSRCGLAGRIAMAYETAPTEAAITQAGDSLPDVKKSAEINLFPNPVQGDNLYIDLSGDDNGDYEVRVYNILGRDVITQPLVGGRNLVSIGALNEGIYFVDVVKKGRTIRTVKLIRK